MEYKRVKIFVFVPKGFTNVVRDAACKAGAGEIGNYTFCTFTSSGIGSFIPNKKAHPKIGSAETLEFVEEDKLEFVCACENVKKVVSAIRKVHPYETPEIDIFPLLEESDF